MTRIAVFCPGRGSYTERSLGSLPADHELVRRAEALRRERDLVPLAELDSAQRFAPSLHLKPSNASALIFVRSMLDAAHAAERGRVVCVGGNSMGWYTALAVAGALGFEDAFRLVQDMALFQEEHAARARGGQVLYPLVDDDWQPSLPRRAAVEEALAKAGDRAFRSIHLGGYAVLAGDEAATRILLQSLPPLEVGRGGFPLRLAQHGPYHTPLQAEVSQRSFAELSDLEFRAPRITLVDGRGRRFAPWSTDPEDLEEYTLGAQVVEPFDFTAAVRVALREFAPDQLLLPGPGNTLGGVVGQVMVAEGWRGMQRRADLEECRERGESPILSMDEPLA